MKSHTPRWRRVLLAILAAVTVAFVIVMTRPAAPIGLWRSGDAHDDFTRYYRAAAAELPRPNGTNDIRTEYGIVRVYRFDGAADAGAPLVLLPGRASTSMVWADNLPSLLTLGDVYTVDLLGEPGMSVQERAIVDDREQAEWLHQTLDALPEPAFHVVGLSIGGWTATNLAIHEPEHVASLTLIDPVLVFADMPLDVVVRSIPASVHWLPRSWRDDFNSWTAGGAPVEDEPIADLIENGMQNYALSLPAPSRIQPESLAALRVPVLAIIAGDSVMHDPASAVEVAEAELADGTVVLVPDASHAINGEQPERITDELEAFLLDRANV